MKPEDKACFAVFVSLSGLPLQVVRLENFGLFWRGARNNHELGIIIEVCYLPTHSPSGIIKIDYQHPCFEWKNKFDFEPVGKTKIHIRDKLPDLVGNNLFDESCVSIYSNQPPGLEGEKEQDLVKKDV